MQMAIALIPVTMSRGRVYLLEQSWSNAAAKVGKLTFSPLGVNSLSSSHLLAVSGLLMSIWESLRRSSLAFLVILALAASDIVVMRCVLRGVFGALSCWGASVLLYVG